MLTWLGGAKKRAKRSPAVVWAPEAPPLPAAVKRVTVAGGWNEGAPPEAAAAAPAAPSPSLATPLNPPRAHSEPSSPHARRGNKRIGWLPAGRLAGVAKSLDLDALGL